ncbi:serine protease, partial [Vibrio cholerae]|nr:serine protease [Vibrio cholerae]
AAFDRMPEIIARGENSARGAERDLARYSASPEVYAAYQKRKQALRKHLTYLQSGTKIDDIVIVNQSRFDEHLIRSKLALTPGMSLSDAEMEARVRRLHALGNFERVDY